MIEMLLTSFAAAVLVSLWRSRSQCDVECLASVGSSMTSPETPAGCRRKECAVNKRQRQKPETRYG